MSGYCDFCKHTTTLKESVIPFEQTMYFPLFSRMMHVHDFLRNATICSKCTAEMVEQLKDPLLTWIATKRN